MNKYALKVVLKVNDKYNGNYENVQYITKPNGPGTVGFALFGNNKNSVDTLSSKYLFTLDEVKKVAEVFRLVNPDAEFYAVKIINEENLIKL